MAALMNLPEKLRDLDEQVARYERLIEAWRKVEREIVVGVDASEAEERRRTALDIIAALERSIRATKERRALIQDSHQVRV